MSVDSFVIKDWLRGGRVAVCGLKLAVHQEGTVPRLGKRIPSYRVRWLHVPNLVSTSARPLGFLLEHVLLYAATRIASKEL